MVNGSIVENLSTDMDMDPNLVQMVLDSVRTEMGKNSTTDKSEFDREVIANTRNCLSVLKDSKPVANVHLFRELLNGGTLDREKAIKALLHGDDAYARIFRARLPIENKMVATYFLN